MKIALTGSKGFIGSHIKSGLLQSGHEVYEHSGADKSAITNGALDLPPADVCIHLASKVFIPDSWEHPFDFYKTNTMGTLAALEYCRLNRAHLIHFSSFVYAVPFTNPILENSALGVSNPYGHSKLLAEEICQFYSKNFDVPVTILRPFNIYGPGQKSTFLIPKIFEQALNPSQERIELQTLTTKRDYLYVEDLSSLVQKALKVRAPGVFNAGSGVSSSVLDVAETILKVTKTKKEIVALGIARKDDHPEIRAEITKTSSIFSWSPKFDLESGLKHIYESSQTKRS